MRIGIKYCGGCNPRFDRGKQIQDLKESFPDNLFEYVSPGETYDYGLLVCGCQVACMKSYEMDTQGGCLLIYQEEDFAHVRRFLSEKLKELEP